jgi:hypothetical protein
MGGVPVSVSRGTVIRWTLLAAWFVAGWAIAIALVGGMMHGDLGTTIRGRIVDKETGQPVRDAVVVGTSGAPLQFVLTRTEARTNQFGIFELKISPTRPTSIKLHAQRYFPTGSYFDPNSLDPEFLEVKMTPARAG